MKEYIQPNYNTNLGLIEINKERKRREKVKKAYDEMASLSLRERHIENIKFALDNRGFDSIPLHECIYFFTVKFDNAEHLSRGAVGHKLTDISRMMRILQAQQCDILLGRRWNRKTHLKPFGFYYVDASGSKHINTATVDDLRFGLHVHAVVLIHPNTAKQWSHILQWRQANPNSPLLKPRGVQQIDIRPIGSDDDLKRVIQYSSKLDRLLRNNIEVGDRMSGVLY